MKVSQFASSKILQHIDRISEWKENKISRPITYELDMTNVCNAKCPFCFGFFEQSKHLVSMNLKEAKKILKQIKSFGGRAVTFTGGGEPLCNKDTTNAIVYAKKIGLDVGFITNGILLNQDIIKDIVNNCTWIRISLDAASREKYKITHGMNSTTFDTVLENIKILVKTKKKYKSSITIGVGLLTYDKTIDDIIPFAKLGLSLGVDYAQYRPLLKKFKEKEINNKNQSVVLNNMKTAEKYGTKNFLVVSSIHKYVLMEMGNTKRQYDICHGHNFATVVAADQKMYLCCHMRGMEKYCIGNLKKNTLKEIWYSEHRKKVFLNINFNDCPLLCRCDSFNTVLFNMQKKVDHVNFL
jgi:MoaA/NifB/PqqE/SkfB family radical SAM enzyme